MPNDINPYINMLPRESFGTGAPEMHYKNIYAFKLEASSADTVRGVRIINVMTT